jgi:hypothetical protein
VLAQIRGIGDASQPGVLELEIKVNNNMAFFSDRQEEKDSAVQWLVELADDPAKMQELTTPMAKGDVLSTASLTLFGFTNTKFAITRSLDQLQRGARISMRSYRCFFEVSQSELGFLKWFWRSLSFDPMVTTTLCYLCPSELHDYALAMLGEGGVKLVEWHDL